MPPAANHHPETRLLRGPFEVPPGYAALSEPVCRASTIAFDSVDAFVARGEKFLNGYTYGLAGTPTHYALRARLAMLEGSDHVALAPSGLAAIHLVNETVLGAGDRVLLSDSVYGPTRKNAETLLRRRGIDVVFYDPLVGEGIDALLTPNTRLVWCESPGSLTLEVQDVAAIARACRKHGVLVALDNTWASPLGFRPLAHGVDFSVQALTKHVIGHGDALLGSVAVRDAALYERLRHVANLMGANVSADDCALALRGLQTMAVRLRAQAGSALSIARWLRGQRAIGWLAFPALDTDPGHALWRRDHALAGSVMSFSLRDGGWDAVRRFGDALRVFRLGASFGGTQSLVAVYRGTGERALPRHRGLDHIVRLSVGLEHAEDLLADVSCALSAAAGTQQGDAHAAQ
jgi:cystathionine beta-lyase